MPLYEYECLKCGDRFEIIQKFSDEPLKVHGDQGASLCDGSVRKLLAAPAIQFKGTGWYVTDYGKGGKKPKTDPGEASAGSKDGPAKDAKPPAKSSESKASKAAAAT